MHQFFIEIEKQPELARFCRTDILTLPEAYKGRNKTKAILLGADPTNNGIKNNPGLKELDFVFGINSEFEKYFFAPQLSNLNALGLDKEDLYIQNVCRNYFMEQTSENRYWKKIANIWLPYLTNELVTLNPEFPVLVTAEKIMELLIPDTLRAKDIYGMEMTPFFFSKYLNRKVYPLYRHPKYSLSKNWVEYKIFLKQLIS